MKYSLLDLTQTILSSMDSEAVNSIGDTVESKQVVQVIKTVYNDIVSRADVKNLKTLFTLDPSTDLTKPVVMYKPSTIKDVEWIKYNKIRTGETSPNWEEISYLEPEAFILSMQGLSTDDDNVSSVVLSLNGFLIELPYKTDVGPTYYTTFDDNMIVFDGYDSDVDDTLQNIKTLAYGLRNLDFVEEDNWIPALQDDQFSLLLNEAKSLAWLELKQSPHQKAEDTSKRNWVHLTKSKRQIPTGSFYSGAHPRLSGPNFGRK